MSRGRLPSIGSSSRKRTVKPILSSSALQRPRQASRVKRNEHQTTSSSASSHPHPGPSSIILSDTTMTPWGGLALSESSFTSIPPRPPPAPPPPPPPPAPQPTPSTPYRGRRSEEEGAASSSSFDSEIPSPPLPDLHDRAVGRGRELQARRRVLPQRRVPRLARLPPLQPVTNLSFSRSFTFSFFELPLHQSPHGRAEHIRNLMLLLRQMHF